MTLWTDEQVACLNAYQAHGHYHPFTCCNRGEPGHNMRWGDLGTLVATRYGWLCPDCGYTQDWAYDFMLTYDPDKHPFPSGLTVRQDDAKSVGQLVNEVLTRLLDKKRVTEYLARNETPKEERDGRRF